MAPPRTSVDAFTGATRLTGQGRPGLRLAAWRAVWGAQRANPSTGPATSTWPAGSRTSSPHPGSDHHRRNDLAAAARHHHHRAGLGSGHRHPRHPTAKQSTRRLTVSGTSSWRPGRALCGI